MDIHYQSRKVERKIQKILAESNTIRAKRIQQRFERLSAAETLADISRHRPERCHALTQGKRGKMHQLSVDLDHPYRLIFVPNHHPIPLLKSGGLDWSRVTAIKILGVDDPH